MSKDDLSGNRVLVVGICGSLRPGSYTRMAVEEALRGAQQAGAQTRLIDLKDYHLIFCDGKDDESEFPDDVFKLRREVGEAGGIILGTPEYHGSFSGVLKNALDLMGSDEMAGKMIGLIGVSGGSFGAVHALSGLRTVGRSLHAWVIPQEVSIGSAYNAFDASGNIKDSHLEKRLRELGREVARFAYLHRSEKAQEFLRAWEASTASINI